MNPRNALIVGGGIGGLAAGLALQRSGWRVRVFERTASARENGFGLGLAPNAMAALRELGVAERVIAEGVVATSFEVRRADGDVLRRFSASLEDAGSPGLSASPSSVTRPVPQPHAGQGAAQALEDAVALALALGQTDDASRRCGSTNK